MKNTKSKAEVLRELVENQEVSALVLRDKIQNLCSWITCNDAEQLIAKIPSEETIKETYPETAEHIVLRYHDIKTCFQEYITPVSNPENVTEWLDSILKADSVKEVKSLAFSARKALSSSQNDALLFAMKDEFAKVNQRLHEKGLTNNEHTRAYERNAIVGAAYLLLADIDTVSAPLV